MCIYGMLFCEHDMSFFLDVKGESRVKINVSFDECNFVSIF